MGPHLPHCVVLDRNFPKEEVDEVSVVEGLDKVGLCVIQKNTNNTNNEKQIKDEDLSAHSRPS